MNLRRACFAPHCAATSIMMRMQWSVVTLTRMFILPVCLPVSTQGGKGVGKAWNCHTVKELTRGKPGALVFNGGIWQRKGHESAVEGMHVAVRALMPDICPLLLGVVKGTHRDLAYTETLIA